MIFLSSSSFFLPQYLTQQLKNNNYSDAQLTFALKKNYVAALILEEKKAQEGSLNWLALNRELAKTQWLSALILGRWYQRIAEQEQKSIMLITAIMWFEQAIRLHSSQAIIDLTQLYFQQNDIDRAQSTLTLLPDILPSNKLGEAAFRLQSRIAIYQGDIVRLNELLNLPVVKRNRQRETQNLLTDLDKYAITKSSVALKSFNNEQRELSLVAPASCSSTLQLFATNLKNLQHLERLINRFKSQQSLAQFVCMPTPRYISIKQIDCLASSQQVITCDEALWQTVVKDVKSRHIGLMLNEGGANVHLGILYFDAQDTAEVFSHEVSHLLGFVDEYPLIKGHDICQKIQAEPFSHNIAVLKNTYLGNKQQLRAMLLKKIPWAKSINDKTPILELISDKSEKNKQWRLGTPLVFNDQVGIYYSETCEAARNKLTSNSLSGYSAFKPVSRRTQLRYYASDFPMEYLSLLKARTSIYLMPSFHYNIALALFQRGEVNEAKYWLRQAALWEDDPIRKAKILQGDF